MALKLVKNFKKIHISGTSVDAALVLYVKIHKGIIATIDIDLKQRIKSAGGSILSLANNRIVIESRKI